MSDIHARGPDEGWFQGAFEQIDAGIVVVQRGRVAYANAKALDMVGQGSDWLGTRVGEFLDDAGPWDLAAQPPGPDAEPRPATRDIDLKRRDGTRVECAVSSTRTEWQGAPAALMVFHDLRDSLRARRAREDNHRALLDALADGVFVAQHERFVYANRALPEMLGYTPGEFIGLPFERVIAPVDLPTWLDRYRARIGDGPEPVRSYDVRFLRRDGSLVEFELIANRNRYEGSPAVLGVLRDVTERKRAELQLEQQRAQLEALVHERTREVEREVAARMESEDFARTMTDHQPTLLAYFDSDLRVRFANQAYLSWLGKSREEVVGQDARTLIGAAHSPRGAAEAVDRVLGGEAFGVSDDMAGANGRIGHFWIYRLPDRRDGEIRGYYFIATDITQLRRSERQLQEANEALVRAESFTRGIADHLPVRIAYWDSEQRCRFANRVYCDWFGKTTEELLGRTEVEVFGERTPEREAHARAALDGELREFDSVEVGRDGREAIWHVHFVPDIEGGRVRGFFKLASDVTVARRAQAELETLNAELSRERDRAEEAAQAKSAFLANMSHEIRTPMNVIIGLTHLMQRDARDPLTIDRLGKVGSAAQHLLDVINDILDLSKIDAGKLVLAPIDFEVDALLERSVALVADAARRKGLSLTVDRGDLPPALFGDPLRLSQALVNLLSNAVKFTERGSVVLQCKVAGRSGDGWVVRFAVRDTGMGIDAETQKRLFAPFEQADGTTTRRFGGTGLGLSITRELVALMGGTLGLESAPGRGSEFWFTAKLGAARPQAAAIAASPAAAIDAVEQQLRRHHGGASVLLVDDNRINQELATELLRLVDLRVDVADNGRVATEMAARASYDLILMDMQMPEMDGLEATRLLRALPAMATTPIIAMTASAFGADRDACLAAGMNDHIGKPVNPATLYDTLLRWFDSSRPPASAHGGRTGPAGPSPAAQSEPTFGPVAGLDVARGLSLFAGQNALYLQALRYFVELYEAGLPGTARAAAGAEDIAPDAVRREIHSMGGAAAALGAVELQAAAQEVEGRLRPERSPALGDPGLRAALADLLARLAALVSAVRQGLARAGATQPPSPKGPSEIAGDSAAREPWGGPGLSS